MTTLNTGTPGTPLAEPGTLSAEPGSNNARAGRRPGRNTRRGNGPGIYVVLLLLLVLVAAPLLSVLVTAVTGYRDEPSALGELVEPGMLKVLGNTIVLSLIVVLFATLFAAPLALFRAWTPMRKAGWVEVLIMVPFMTPPFAAAMAWMDFTRVRGVADMLLGETLGGFAHDAIYSVWGMGFIMAAELFPFLYLILRNCFEGIPASQLEMAQVAGASRWQQFTRIIAPMVVGPYSLGALIVFIKAAGEFGTPVTLGNAIGYKVLVSSIYEDVTIDPLSFSSAAATSSVLFALGVTAWAIQQWASRKDLTGGGRASRPVRLRASKSAMALAWVYSMVVFALSVFIPYISIVLAAMTILRSKAPTPNNLTFDYFAIVLSMPSAQEALTRSIVLGAIGATTAVLVALAITLLTMRRSTVVAKLTDFLAVAPDTVPGIVLAIGFILLWNSPNLPWTPYGTQIILVMAFTVLFTPMAVQNVKTSAASMSPTMLEAAAICGATPAQTFTRVTVPLLAPGLFAGWLLAFFVGIRELVMSSLIRPSNINLLAPWIMNQYDQGHRAEAMAMTLIGVGTSTLVLVLVRWWQSRHAR
ncbi:MULTISPECIES: ABC transporter permease [Corynebacterium]|uniref:ABC transporter permease n=1 Tax=Corynebacterium TaxID=1716 RepID=UPI001E63E189|nr:MULTISPECIES: iron ABC transporter permease [Corynebacterium]WKC59366.1 Putative 2-aminoethylphosphonate transport system permease protein PhnV [Corynebacterium hadale]